MKRALNIACTFPLTEWEKTQAELLGPEIKKAQSQRKTTDEQIKRRRLEAVKEKDHDLQKREFYEIAEMEASLVSMRWEKPPSCQGKLPSGRILVSGLKGMLM